MPRLKNPNRRAALLEKQKAIQTQLRNIDRQEKQSARKDDTRGKIIIGGIARTEMQKNPQGPLALRLRELMLEFVEPRDRHLFPFLPALESAAPQPSAPVEVTGTGNAETKGGFYQIPDTQ